MLRAGRGNKRRFDDHHGRDTRPTRVAWEEDFDYEVRQLKRNAIENHGTERGIPVLSFKFIGEGKIRDAHRILQGGGGDLRDRIAPRNSSAPAAATADGNAAKRQKKGKETTGADSGKGGAKKDGNAKTAQAKLPKESKEESLKRFDDELDSYFGRAEQDATPKKEDKPAAEAEKSKEETAK